MSIHSKKNPRENCSSEKSRREPSSNSGFQFRVSPTWKAVCNTHMRHLCRFQRGFQDPRDRNRRNELLGKVPLKTDFVALNPPPG